MNDICLKEIVPEVFCGQNKRESEIWHRDLTFSKGTTYLLEAVSGAGKSSLCSYIYGYRSDYRGTIFFNENNIRDFSATHWSELRRNSLSILFQDLRLFPELTALENVVIKNRLTNFKNLSWIHDCFELLGIGDKQATVVSKLSFGQQQRVALLRALCQPFDFIILDEPVSHLDERNNRIMGELLKQEAQQQQAGILVTSIGTPLTMQYDKILQL